MNLLRPKVNLYFFYLAAINFMASSTLSLKSISSSASFRNLENPPNRTINYESFNNVNTIARCGETHHTNTGNIFYKPFEQVLANERCAWIVGVPGAVAYRVNVEYLGAPTNQPNSGQKLVLTGVQYNGADPPILTTYSPTEAGSLLINDANAFVVTFQSSTMKELGTGFYLQYEDTQIGNISRTSISSVYHVFDSPLFKFRHPPTETTYTDNELSVFIFPPGNNIYTNYSSNIYYQQNGIQSDCRDSLFVYTFNASSDSSMSVWQDEKRICDDIHFQHVPYSDMVLILFQSDLATVGNGFWFWYTGC